MSPIAESTFEDFVDEIPIDKVVDKMSTAKRGQRVWPSRTSKNDEDFNFRVDMGSTLPDGRQELVFQANKNAKDKNVRQAAQKDSHSVTAKVAIKPEDGPVDIKEEAMESFRENQKSCQ